ncbi:8-oxo-dGTP diphosphatase [Psychrobacter sp. PL15]|uniref:NUDIX domain-containing protein n=1 Tax=Psychrobacter sp. PL15 TaxID=3071719 RepID=UPI002DFA6DA7|nr:8-oxo-dGTP diphosphatase [Psychrobacter sp. PL15]
MLNKTKQQISTDDKAVAGRMVATQARVTVAVAVIHYQQQYLLGFRSSTQHQGNRYEFVGGKTDKHETVSAALVREVGEETGIDIQNNNLVKLGRLHHDYGDKQVCLQVYKVALTAEQYKQHQHCDYGLEGQALTWVDKIPLLAGHYPLPAANRTILAWLQLPAQITITHPLAPFSEYTDVSNAWFDYHQQYISKGAWVYIRTKAAELENTLTKAKRTTDAELAIQLMRLRPDIHSIVTYDYAHQDYAHQIVQQPNSLEITQLATNNENVKISKHIDTTKQVMACHLTHHEVMQWFNAYIDNDCQDNDSKKSVPAGDFSKDQSKGSRSSLDGQLSRLPLIALPLIISCHDADSIYAANQLAATRLQNQLSPVIGIFLSPVLATKTHPDSEPLGWKAWSELAELADMPVIGLGGLSPLMIDQAEQHGALSVAGIRQFLGQ